MKRRTALKYLGALAGAAVSPRGLTGCGAADERVAAGLTTIVIVCMENRSYDHYLGARSLLEGKPGDGLRPEMANPDRAGQMVRVFRAGAACVADPPHGWRSSHEQWGEGRNDGFVKAYQEEGAPGPEVMGYLTRAELPVTWALADAGTTCDRWFCSVMGPTWPNRMYLHSGQSGGLSSNTLPTGAGGFTWPSIYHRLDEAGVPWAYYYSNIPFVPLWRDIGERDKARIRRVEHDFFDDAEAGTLPNVVFIDPAFYLNDDHPPLPPVLGQQFLAAIYNALAASPQWPNILLVVTYDEHGGFYDHVPPPRSADDRAADGFDQLGFRVPTVIAGPYVKPGFVSSVVYDHTSVLAQIRQMFSLRPLGARDAAASDLSDVIDGERLAARSPLPPVALPLVETSPELLTGCAGLKLRSDFDDLADRGYIPPHLDLRAEGPALLRAIARRARR